MKRPFPVTLFAVAVLSLAAFNLLFRFAQAIQMAGLMADYDLQAPLAANLFTGGVWAVAWGAAAIGLYRLRAWARRATLIGIVLYELNLWLIRLALEKSSSEPLTRPADAALSALVVLLVWGLLWLPPVRRAFLNREA